MRDPALSHPSATVYLGDCLDVLAEMPDDSIDAIVTDPPYGLGFMGKAWDDLPPGLPWAQECLRVLKPGGHLLAFGGTRTWHRLAVAVEDAGFEVRDSIAWLYGSGFPKSLDVSKAIDKTDAAEERLRRAREFQTWLREHITSKRINEITSTDMGHHLTTHPTQPAVATADLFDLLRPHLPEVPERIEELVRQRTVESANFKAREVVGIDRRMNEPSGIVGVGQGERTEIERKITNAHTPAAQQWTGWGTALKPAFEPIVVARKPLVGTVAANVLAHGTGALNIDECRVEGGKRSPGFVGSLGAVDVSGSLMGPKTPRTNVDESQGRWPANVLLDDTAAAELDAGQPVTKSSGGSGDKSGKLAVNVYGDYAGTTKGANAGGLGDSGGPSRYFPTFRDNPVPVYLTRSEWRRLHGAAHAGVLQAIPENGDPGKALLDHIFREGVARPAEMEGEAVFRYQAKAPTRERPTVVAEDGTKTAHPTVKPLALMRWLVRLVTPPGGTVLDTFAGSGATIEAAIEEGFHAVGIEREADYLPLIQLRLDRVTVPEEPTE